jgi:ABC-type transporter Mla MlaB component
MNEMAIERWQDPEAPGKQGLKVCGSVTIGEASRFKDALLDALGVTSELQVDLCGVTEIDLTGLQLLCATHQSALAAGKKFSVSAVGSLSYLDVVTKAGFLRDRGCARDVSGTCIWVGGKC